jgi:hypothetical protein
MRSSAWPATGALVRLLQREVGTGHDTAPGTWLDVPVMTTGEGARDNDAQVNDGLEAPAGRDQLTFDQAAELARLPVQTLRTYRTRNTFPAPDGYLGRTPWWYRSTVLHWLQVRPLRGQRGRGRPKGDGP